MKPNLFLVAAPRSGSTQLAHWLNSHDDVSLSPVKEPNFFSHHLFQDQLSELKKLNDVDPRYPVTGRPGRKQFAVFGDQTAYDALYDGIGTKWRLDASTSYLSTAGTAEKVAAYNQEAFVIVLTREPVARAVSHYHLARRTGRSSASLAWELAAELGGLTPKSKQFLVRPSLYKNGIAEFDQHFGPDQLMYLTFENLITDPVLALLEIARFLNIDELGFDLSVCAQNKSAEPRFEKLNATLEGSGLKTVLRRHLPHWAKPVAKSIWFSSKVASISDDEITNLSEAIWKAD